MRRFSAPKLLARSVGDERGVTLVEFALILPALLLFVMGGLELGYRLYAIAVTNGALREAARLASTGAYTGAEIDAKVNDMIKAFRSDASIVIVKKSYSDFTGVGVAEPIISGSIASGTYCYQDVNRNGTYDEDQGANGLGGAEDVIYYEVGVTYSSLFPIPLQSIGIGPNTMLKMNTIVSNEPFAPASRSTPPTKCVS